MLILFLAAFCTGFVALSGAYVWIQRRQSQLAWVLVYLVLIGGLAWLMYWLHQYFFFEPRNYLRVGTGTLLVAEVGLAWFGLAGLVIAVTFYTRSQCRTDRNN